METKTGTTQEFNRLPFARDLHEIQPVFPEADFGLGITNGLPVNREQSRSLPTIRLIRVNCDGSIQRCLDSPRGARVGKCPSMRIGRLVPLDRIDLNRAGVAHYG